MCIEEVWSEFFFYMQYEICVVLVKCGLIIKYIESCVFVLSGGEKVKVRLCKLINLEINLLVFDELINYLDVDVKEEFKCVFKEYKGFILFIFYELEFYMDIVIEMWNCEFWMMKVF